MSESLRAEGDWVAFDLVRNKLNEVAESGVDSGMGPNGRDFWLRVNGAEYFVNMSRSKRQISIDDRVDAQKDK